MTKIDHAARFDATSPDAIVGFGFASRTNVLIEAGIDDGVTWTTTFPNIRDHVVERRTDWIYLGLDRQ